MHYRYVKAYPRVLSKKLTVALRLLPLVLVLAGMVLVGSVVYPFASYQLVLAPSFSQKMVSPLVVSPTANEGKAVLGEKAEVDLTTPGNWFPQAPKPSSSVSRITHYLLSLPRLKIEKATVTIGGENLKETLVHYPGTALPGRPGTSVIFGHSVLPQFFNPKNYLTIFSTLPTLEKGDEILVDFDGISYRFIVTEMMEVEPTDLSPLEQKYDNSYLTLITCVPPGTYLRRLVVSAKIADPINNEENFSD